MTDDDMVHAQGYWIYDEGGGQQYRGRDEMTVHLQYTERNVGAMFANATFALRPKLGWTNRCVKTGWEPTGREFFSNPKCAPSIPVV